MLKYLLFFILIFSYSSHISAQDAYPKDPDSQVQPNVPKGEILELSFSNSKIFPGTIRKYSVYIPAQYTPEHPACVYVNLDGIQFNSPVVFDNLIHKNEIPITIGVYVGSGVIYREDKSVLRYNRSFEFDGVNDNFPRFLLEELLPEVENLKTKDGRAIVLSKNGNDRAIAGLSSGGIGAFKTAWERPDQFSRVFSGIGTYVGMRGGDRYPVLVRKTEPKPIRIFLQDGSNDVWNALFGSWYLGNIDLEAALSFAGYEVDHEWGNGGHSDTHASSIFPKVIKWLWKGWPNPVKEGNTNNDMLKSILVSDEPWKLVDGDYSSACGLAANKNGELFFNDSSKGSIYKISKEGKINIFAKTTKIGQTLAFDQEGRLRTGALNGEFYTYTEDGLKKKISSKIFAQDFFVANNGDTYYTEKGSGETNKIWLIRQDGSKVMVDSGKHNVSALAISPDKSLLFMAEGNTQWVYSYIIKGDGTLQYKQKFYWLHVSESGTDSGDLAGVTDMAIYYSGLLYVASNMGIQVCDRNGRVRAILPLPGGPVTSLCFGGEKMDILFATSAGKIYQRKLNVRGNHFWEKPITLPQANGG